MTQYHFDITINQSFDSNDDIGMLIFTSKFFSSMDDCIAALKRFNKLNACENLNVLDDCHISIVRECAEDTYRSLLIDDINNHENKFNGINMVDDTPFRNITLANFDREQKVDLKNDCLVYITELNS